MDLTEKNWKDKEISYLLVKDSDGNISKFGFKIRDTNEAVLFEVTPLQAEHLISGLNGLLHD